VIRYSREMFSRLKTLRREIVGKHEACGGKGVVPGELCICSKVFSYVKGLVAGDIPRAYWTLKWEELQVDEAYKKLLSLYFDNFGSAKSQALGILFLGPNGVGKTAMMCEIGKEAIIQGWDTFYITTQRLIGLSMAGEKDDRLHQSDVILLDEVDKAYIKAGSDFVPKTFEDYLRSSISRGKMVIAASNEDEGGLEEMFGQSTLSMIRRHLKIVPVSGDDFSDKRQDGWTRMLKDKIDWFHPNILESAERRFEKVGVLM
jgi:hypothetical protein